MEDSFKGYLTTFVLATIFMIAILNFIVIFPQEQGVTFDSDQDQSVYLTINTTKNSLYTSTELSTIETQTDSGFEQWDIEVGFMGSNTQKGSKGNAQTYSSNVLRNLKIIATELFGGTSPIVWAIGILITLLTIYGTLVFIKFLRTGN